MNNKACCDINLLVFRNKFYYAGIKSARTIYFPLPITDRTANEKDFRPKLHLYIDILSMGCCRAVLMHEKH